MQTNMSAALPQQRKSWSTEAIRAYRAGSVLQRYTGTGENSFIQEINDLTPTEAGTICGVGLVQDLAGNGVLDDNELEGHEEALDSSWVEIELNKLSHAVRERGSMEEKRSAFKTRDLAKERLAFWRVRMMEELQVLTLSGVPFQYNIDGSLRADGNLAFMKSSIGVTAPSSNRQFMPSSTGLVVANTAAMTSANVLNWNSLVDAKAQAVAKGIKPMKVGQREYHGLFLCPFGLAQLRRDPDYRQVLTNADERGANNGILAGADLTINGLMITSLERIYNTTGAAAGLKGGASGNVDYSRGLLLGCQALLKADVWSGAKWEEDTFNYRDATGFAMKMMIGFKKPVFKNRRDGNTLQDHGVIAIDYYRPTGAAS